MSFSTAISPRQQAQSCAQGIKNNRLSIGLLGIGVILTTLGIVLQIVLQGQGSILTLAKVTITLGASLTLAGCMMLIFKKCTHKVHTIMQSDSSTIDNDSSQPIKRVAIKPQSIGLETNKQRTKRLHKTARENAILQNEEQQRKTKEERKKNRERQIRLEATEKRLKNANTQAEIE